jgi:hypothetical protein
MPAHITAPAADTWTFMHVSTRARNVRTADAQMYADIFAVKMNTVMRVIRATAAPALAKRCSKTMKSLRSAQRGRVGKPEAGAGPARADLEIMTRPPRIQVSGLQRSRMRRAQTNHN